MAAPLPFPTPFSELPPTAYADFLTKDAVMDFGIRPLWEGMPRLAGPAFPVECPAGDNLMFHAAIHRAPPGSVIVAKAGDLTFALAGGNVCAVAQRRGIAGFVLDGLIRDVGEIRRLGFPVFARGLSPIPGGKKGPGVLEGEVTCGGVRVSPGDVIVGDEEGLVVLPRAGAQALLAKARERAAKDESTSLDAWETAHRARIEAILAGLSTPV